MMQFCPELSVLVKRRKHVDVMGISLQNEEFTGVYTWDTMGLYMG
jgi:hypothetical protein